MSARKLLVSSFIVMSVCAIASPTVADALADAKAGVVALDGFEYAKAVALFTRAIKSGRLNADDKELAYIKRAQAYIGERNTNLALADLATAEKLKPDDQDIPALRARAEGKAMDVSASGAPVGSAIADAKLAEAMAFLEQNIPSSVSYSMTSHISAGAGFDDTHQSSVTIDNVKGDASTCSISYTYGDEGSNSTRMIDLRTVQLIENMSLQDYQTQYDQDVNSNLSVTDVSPPISVAHVEHSGSQHPLRSGELLYFSSQSQASQVATALKSASDLCHNRAP